MLTLDALRDFGADVKGGLERCMNNESFYLRLVKMALSDNNVDRLRESLASGDLDAAFEAAHALKGVLGNLSLTPVYEPVAEVTELLRARAGTDYAPYMKTIGEAWDRLQALAGE